MNRSLVDVPRSIVFGLLALGGCTTEAPPSADAPKPAEKFVFDEDVLVFFQALPAVETPPEGSAREAQVNLGRMLYYDTRLSKNHDLSCNSCHLLDQYGVDNQKTSPGHKGQLGARNSPTVYNARFYIAQFWDGRAADLADQAKGPVLNPVEMAMPSEEHVVKVLESIPGYVEAFKKAFPEDKNPVTYQRMAEAIGAFEEGLLTPSRFDAFLAGDRSALTEAEQAGLMKFAELGCTTCHNGPAIGGSSFQRIGQVLPYDDESDLGRFDVTKQAPDRLVFKVPSLRNITKTGPYFHNGRFDDLHEAVRTMAKHQLGKNLSAEEIGSIIAFLESLSGELPKNYIAKPELPPSGPNTPQPDPS